MEFKAIKYESYQDFETVWDNLKYLHGDSYIELVKKGADGYEPKIKKISDGMAGFFICGVSIYKPARIRSGNVIDYLEDFLEKNQDHINKTLNKEPLLRINQKFCKVEKITEKIRSLIPKFLNKDYDEFHKEALNYPSWRDSITHRMIEKAAIIENKLKFEKILLDNEPKIDIEFPLIGKKKDVIFCCQGGKSILFNSDSLKTNPFFNSLLKERVAEAPNGTTKKEKTIEFTSKFSEDSVKAFLGLLYNQIIVPEIRISIDSLNIDQLMDAFIISSYTSNEDLMKKFKQAIGRKLREHPIQTANAYNKLDRLYNQFKDDTEFFPHVQKAENILIAAYKDLPLELSEPAKNKLFEALNNLAEQSANLKIILAYMNYSLEKDAEKKAKGLRILNEFDEKRNLLAKYYLGLIKFQEKKIDEAKKIFEDIVNNNEKELDLIKKERIDIIKSLVYEYLGSIVKEKNPTLAKKYYEEGFELDNVDCILGFNYGFLDYRNRLKKVADEGNPHALLELARDERENITDREKYCKKAAVWIKDEGLIYTLRIPASQMLKGW